MTMTDGAARAKQTTQSAMGRLSDELIALSHQIHANPELSFEEVRASRWCADALHAGGFEVDFGICELPTAFRASIGSGPLTISICCEYDALPDIGHACGHNIIAAAAVGAGLSLAEVADDLGLRIVVLGTPAEEGGGGKIYMIERGGFDGLNASMMVHPWPTELIQMPCLAVSHFDTVYSGVEAHASAFPELGVNAADAITVAQVAIGLLRQHAHPGDQVHGIVTHGGSAPNIVPAHTSAKYYVRAASLEALKTWEPRVINCFHAGALATGASLEVHHHSPPYSEFLPDQAMASLYKSNAEHLGRFFPEQTGKPVAASTDMANVSLVMPAIHPTLGIDSLPAVNHQAAFAAHCATPVADKALIDGATAMAWTVVDLATDEAQRARLLSHTFTHSVD
jgi:amidohydrolase